MYRLVGDRLALSLSSVSGLSVEETKKAIRNLGIEIMPLTPQELLRFYARQLAGKSKYKRRAQMSEAPEYFDCSGLTKWLYGRIGIWLPRRSIAQFGFANSSGIEGGDFQVGDLIFKKGRVNYYFDDPDLTVGHVGLVIEAEGSRGSVIHATQKRGIEEVPLRYFMENKNYRGRRWVVASWDDLVVLRVPGELEIEASEDLKWLLLTKDQ